MRTTYESHFVAPHALERRELRGKVVAVHALFAALARRARKLPVSAASLANNAGLEILKKKNLTKMIISIKDV